MTDVSEPKPKRYSFSITAVLVFGSAGLTFVAVGLALFLGFSSAAHNTRTLLYGQSEQLIDGMLKDVDLLLGPVQRQVAWMARQVAEGEVDPNDGDDWQRYIEAVPAATPQVISIGFVTPDFKATIYQTRQKFTAVTDFSSSKSLKKLAATIKGPMPPQWFEPTLAPGRNLIDLVVWIPLYRNDKFLGVYFQSVAATSLDKYLAKNAPVEGLTPFIVYDNSWILMHPGMTEWQKKQKPAVLGEKLFRTGNNVPLPGLEELNDPVINDIWSANRAFIDRNDGKTLTRITTKVVDGERYIYIYRDIATYGVRPWTVGAYFNEDRSNEAFIRLRNLAIGGLVILVLAVLAAALIGRRTARPVHRLAAAARSIQSGVLEDVALLPPSRLREMNEASQSFNQMIDGLKERERIRGLFGKYVPESIAQKILEDEGGLKPQSAEATVLFVDLAGFTALSETLEPEAIVSVLNDYFSAVVRVIESYDGLITQFQGDAILAIFNVPVSNPNHAQNAVDAALDVQRVVHGTKFGGLSLACRVGINTGPVVAGNVGAEDRMNYTVHGDAVNLAARLEQLNKDYGSGILVSGSTAALVTGMEFKRIGEMEIRGKSEVVTVFSPVNPNLHR